MIVDSSALIAVVFQEPGYKRIVTTMKSATAIAIGSPTLAEAGIVLHARLGDTSAGMLERILDEFDIQEVPFGELHSREAVDAFRRYGKGRHPAQLNVGDCMTYAVARLTGEPLLFTGNDFSHTDVDTA